jgi:hypothetical protein
MMIPGLRDPASLRLLTLFQFNGRSGAFFKGSGSGSAFHPFEPACASA